EAVELWLKALEIDEAADSNSLQMAHSASLLASCFDDLGRSGEAERYHNKALAAFEKALGRSSTEASCAELALTTCRYVQ
ncbi:unnamed protein product, partial [Symbiodinium pilosum]